MTEHVSDQNQLDTIDGRQYPHTDCGLAVAAGMAIDAGQAVESALIFQLPGAGNRQVNCRRTNLGYRGRVMTSPRSTPPE